MMSHSDRRMSRIANAGFTLGEVAISAALLTIGVLVLALFIPAGLKAQQQARFKLYAAAQVVDMIETFTNAPQIQAAARVEAAAPWDVASGYAAYQPDFEQKLSSPMYGIAPVPTRIAQRLDSTDNLIQKILAEGGRLYFTNPRGAAGLQAQNVIDLQPPTDAQRIVFAVIGSPQQNALPHLPMQAWPQYIPYPSGPLTVRQGENVTCWEAQADADVNVVWKHDFGDADGAMKSGFLWYAGQTEDQGGQNKFLRSNDTSWSNWGNMAIGRNKGPGWLSAKYYVALAMWYAAKKGLPTSFIQGTPSAFEFATAANDPNQVRAIRILAHAGMCLTKHFTLDPATGEAQFGPETPLLNVGPNGGPVQSTHTWYESIDHPGLRAGIPIPGTDTRAGMPVVVPGRTLPVPNGLTALYALPGSDGALAAPPLIPDYLAALGGGQQALVSHATIVHWHELCMQVAMAAAANPYDWRVPRPTNRALCTDFPLTQWDVCKTPRSGFIAGTQSDPNMPAASGQAKQWWSIAGAPVQGGQANDGRLFDWPTESGDQKHYNLGAPFSAAERTRMLVFWAVDWTEYNDFETAPSAQVDASRYMICPPKAPLGSYYPNGLTFTTDRMSRLTSRWGTGSISGLNTSQGETQMSIRWYDRFQPCSRNAEKAWLFVRPVTATIPGVSDLLPAGSGVLPITIGPDYEQNQSDQSHAYIHSPRDGGFGDAWNFTADQGWGDTYGDGSSCPIYPDGKKRADGRLIFSGSFGGDRNGDRALTKGPLPAAVRLRAVEVGRFIFYDPRLTMNVR